MHGRFRRATGLGLILPHAFDQSGQLFGILTAGEFRLIQIITQFRELCFELDNPLDLNAVRRFLQLFHRLSHAVQAGF